MKNIYFIFLLFIGSIGFAQEVPVTTQQQLENLADATEDESQEDDQYLQQLDYLRKHPINVNTATEDDLQLVRFLTDLQINNLIRYRNLFGKLVDIYELQSIPTWDLITIKKLLPYITISSAVSLKENFISRFKGEQSVLFRISRVIERSKGYDTSLSNHYLGDRNHYLLRYRYQYKNLLYFGFAADKDPGEQFFKGAQSRGFDFYSFHFFVRKLGMIKSLALGDFTINLGQGLIQWQSLGFGKSSEVMAIKRQSPIVGAYRSAGEYNFNRGLAVTLQKRNFEATAFASYKKISGNIINDTTERFSSILTSGYYRTNSEIADRNKVAQTSFGGNISYLTSSLKLGINTVVHQFDIPLQKRDEPYNRFAFNGRRLFNSSLDYGYSYKNIHLFGEVAVDKNFNKAFINGALISVDPKVDLSVLYRNIQMEYQSLFGNAFTENTLPSNEKGFYCGISVKPISSWQINAYADFYQFPWLRFRVNAPTRGFDYLLNLNYQPNKQFEIYFRYRNENKPLNNSDSVIHSPEDKIRQSIRIRLSTQIKPEISFRSRVEMLWYDLKGKNKEEGFLAFIEGNYQVSDRIQSNLRLQYFETGGYNSRIYAYETDVLYSFSIPAFYDKGLRYYLNLNYSPTKKLTCWFRWAQTIYKNKNQVGSGLDLINGNEKSEAKFQILYKF